MVIKFTYTIGGTTRQLVYLTIAFVIGIGIGILIITSQPRAAEYRMRWGEPESYHYAPIIIPNYSPDYTPWIIDF